MTNQKKKLGAYNQIEIYPYLVIETEFSQRVETLLELTTIKEVDRIEFIESIRLISEGNDKYYQYKQTKLIFDLPYNNQIEWSIDFFNWPNQKLKHEIRLGVPSESLLYGKHPNIQYKEDLIKQIEYLMMKINSQKENEVLLFTDEASEGNFIAELEGKLNSVNYLFDIAIIPSKIQWNINVDKYEMVEDLKNQKKYRSKHNYMKSIKSDCN